MHMIHEELKFLYMYTLLSIEVNEMYGNLEEMFAKTTIFDHTAIKIELSSKSMKVSLEWCFMLNTMLLFTFWYSDFNKDS